MKLEGEKMARKILTDENLEQLGILLTQQVNTANTAFWIGANSFGYSTSEFRELVKSLDSAKSMHSRLHSIAENRGWTLEKINSVFKVKSITNERQT